ncbi:NAD(P)/FAD-dependent oxidoreductase [Rheinheimera pleomorphica]|uniref:NAD(P)/FAD-dependent oxidoreductase n=1 Tax=Rheinheimera pleomorphica TaxID=2703963 RepID=UPI001423A612|nr:FAD-dependent oxidoreductase [Rheinheimera pleomorphica]
MSIAIIGAGMAGAACASRLVRQGQQVTVFDKGRSAGGRMSSKRTVQGYLDLGAQYFTARDAAFMAQCQHWLRAGNIAQWQGRLARLDNGIVVASPDESVRFVGAPSMQAPVAALLHAVSLHTGCQVDQLAFDGKRWQLFSAGVSLGQFNHLVLAIPQQQAEQLLQYAISLNPELNQLFATPALLPCWAVNVTLAHSPWPYDGIFGETGHPLSWLARQGSKPGRCQGEHWLLHFSAAFSQQYLEADSSEIAKLALQALQQLTGEPLSAKVSHCHRWRYAQQNPAFPHYGMVYRPELALGLAGDWLNGGRVENAWLSGVQLARELQR